MFKILFIGDIVGNVGTKIVKEKLKSIIESHNIDFCIANGENAASGKGITLNIVHELCGSGVNVITMGNHTWAKKEIVNFIDDNSCILRPSNYPSGVPGKGYTIFETAKGKIGVINLLGRVYMESMDCPFKTADQDIEFFKRESVKIIIVDIHAEATAEKMAMGWYLDGRVSAVLGTHTHVQTADERILLQGTGFITDVGMTGPHEGVIGVTREIIIKKFINRMPVRFETAQGIGQLNAVIIDIDQNTGKTLNIVRLNQVFK